MDDTQKHEEALVALADAKQAVKDAKAKKAEYLKKNKLKKTEDHSADEVHGPKLAKLDTTIGKKEATVVKKKEAAKKAKPSKVRESKYEYPEGCESAKDKKRHRTKLRNEAAGKKPKAKKERVEKGSGEAPKKKKKTIKKAEGSEDKPTKKKKKKTTPADVD